MSREPDELEHRDVVNPQPEPPFGIYACKCKPFTRLLDSSDSEVDTVDAVRGWTINPECPHHRHLGIGPVQLEVPPLPLPPPPERLGDLMGRELIVQARIEAIRASLQLSKHRPLFNVLDDAKTIEEWILRESTK